MSRGTTLVELLVGASLGLAVVAMLTAAVGAGGRLLAVAGARGEGEDTAQLALEAFVFDVRRSGYDPRATGVRGLVEARPDRVTLVADLDGDGTVDATSEETTAYVCTPAARRLSRILGRQSLPLAEGVARCAFRYMDASGAEIAVPASGLPVGDLRRIRALALDLTLLPARLAGATARTALVALRTPS